MILEMIVYNTLLIISEMHNLLYTFLPVSTHFFSAKVIESVCAANLSESTISFLIAAVSFSSPSNGSSGRRYPTTLNVILMCHIGEEEYERVTLLACNSVKRIQIALTSYHKNH